MTRLKSVRGALQQIREAVAPPVVNALEVSLDALEDRGIPYLLIGGLAVVAHGYVRATKDVDFLVGDQAFTHHRSGLVTLKAGMPFRVGDVPVDLMGIPVNFSPTAREHLGRILARGPGLVPLEDLLYLKLVFNRPRDQADVVGLLQAGVVDPDRVAESLRGDYGAETLVSRFERLIEKAMQER